MEDPIADLILAWYQKIETKELKVVKFGALACIPVSVLLFSMFISNTMANLICFSAFAISCGFIVFSIWLLGQILEASTGTRAMQEVADPIREGSEGFFITQYGTIFKLSFLCSICLFFIYAVRDPIAGSELNHYFSVTGMAFITSMSFLIGAVCSAIAGYAGIWVSVRANVRVAAACRNDYNKAIQLCFRGGAFAAIINVALAIFGISFLFLILSFHFYLNAPHKDSVPPIQEIPVLIVGFGFGASFVAMFAQLGGGIFTKAADVGADLVGKVEQSIPEDDPRNPATIADLVGDNVGDCAGQCADLFESISAEILSAMILGGAMAGHAGLDFETKSGFILFPLVVHSLDLTVSTIAVFFVYTKPGHPSSDRGYGELEDPLYILKRGYYVSLGLAMAGLFVICRYFLYIDTLPNAYLYFYACSVVGVVVSFLFVAITQYYTDYNFEPVQSIASSSQMGHATNIITGLSVGLESTGLPIITISVGVISSYYLGQATGISNSEGEMIGGLYGTAIATMGMFASGVFVLSMSGFGPIADNAGGIVEMSEQPSSVRDITDRLDAVGNVTKANTKGYSVGSAAMACFLLFSAYLDEVEMMTGQKFKVIDIAVPEIYVGGLLGSMTVFVFSAWSIKAVGVAAEEVIKEVRRQFKEHPGIMTYEEKPDYKQCVSIVNAAGLKQMIKPGLLSVLSPIIVGVTFRIIGSFRNRPLLGAEALAGFLMFSTSTGILMALFFNNGGGAWDNAKKYIETGKFGGKGSEAHKAAVTGDTVGDPCKDTAGPSIHILIKLLSTITLVLVPLFSGNGK